ncbi:MAG: hypothetical protein ACP5OV_00730 [Acidimicrobiales bacterium]
MTAPAPDAVRAAGLARGAQVVWIAPLALCALLDPHVAASEGGVSNYGNHLATAPLYVVSFAGNALVLLGAARAIAGVLARPRALAWGLRAVAVLELVVLATTFVRRYSFTWSLVHDDLGVAQFAAAAGVAVVIVARWPRPSAFVFLGVQVAGSLGGLLSALRVIHLLFWGQVVGSLAFAATAGIVLARGVADAAGGP